MAENQPFGVHVPVIKVRQPDGSYLVRAGEPEIIRDEEELTTTQFAAAVGLSASQVTRLCDSGEIPCRRPGGPKGKRLIPRSEVLKRRERNQP